MARYCLFLGAGFSKWASDLPLVSGLFDFALEPYNSTEKARLARLQRIFDAWRSANPQSYIEEFIAHAQGQNRLKPLVNWYVTRRLTDSFVSISGKRRTYYINSYYVNRHPGVQKARLFFDLVASAGPISIVTTNYDLLPEYSLGSRGMNYGVVGEQIGLTPYPYIQPVFALGKVPVAKLHGSVSWSDTGEKATDSRYGLNGKGLIVPPVAEKEATPLLLGQWELAANSLSRADRIIFFGFSFNENDLAVRLLVSGSLKNEASLVFVDPADHRHRLDFLTGGRVVDWFSPIGLEPAEVATRIVGSTALADPQQELPV